MGLSNLNLVLYGGDTMADFYDSRWAQCCRNNSTTISAGEAASSSFSTSANQAATATALSAQRYVSGAVSGTTAIITGDSLGSFWARACTGTFALIDLTLVRFMFGLGTAALTADLLTSDYAAFRYSTSAGDTTWQCMTCDNSARVITNSGVLVSTTKVSLGIVCLPTISVKFYINNVLVATHTSRLPRTSVTAFCYRVGCTPLENVAKSLDHYTYREKYHV